MGLFDQDLLLPGVITEIISDYSSGYDTSLFGTTDSVAIIGTAFNGPVGKPVEIYSPEHARYIFGSTYDSKTRREATLVANIQDAWDRGCRTIYAVRVSGKEIYKDYQLACDTNLKLRVAGMFPSNSNKDICLVYNDSAFDMAIEIFKPASRATMNEKNQGLVDQQDSVLVNKIDLYNSGISKDDDLVELIKNVNEYPYNTVLRLSIVDENGNDVTLSSKEAKGIKVGDMFPGLYTIGRDVNAPEVKALTVLDLVMDKKPYESFEGKFYKKLSLNTNVAKDLPIYDENGKLSDLIGISAINQYDFLEVPGRINDVFLKDKKDYEEVDISNFELYKRLGRGFAINAEAHVSKDDITQKVKVKVKEVVDKAKKKTGIQDGMYSMLENLDVKYRVLAGVSADEQIKGKLPKAEEFKFAKAGSAKILNGAIEIVPKLSKKDLTKAKTFKVAFDEMEEADEEKLETVKANLYIDKTIRQATLKPFAELATDKEQYKEGSIFLVTEVTGTPYSESINLLYTFTNGEFKSLHEFSTTDEDQLKDSLVLAGDKIYKCTKQVQNSGNSSLKHYSFVEAVATDFMVKEEKAKFAIASLDNGSFVVLELTDNTVPSDPEILMDATGLTASILGTVDTVLSEDEDKLTIALSDCYNENAIVIKSNSFDFLTIDEVAERLNEDKDFSKLFEVKVLDITKAQEYISDVKLESGSELKATIVDRTVDYDTNLLIPFRTDDNFARHLAQHCFYTSLKTAPTHGVIGVKILLDTSLGSISNRVKQLVDINLESMMVGKKDNGTNMLDRNNMPYPIGRKISIVVGQYAVTTDDNYTYISNMAAGYAGMVSGLPLDQSSTCQQIVIPEPMYELTNYQLGSLTASGLVTIKKSYTNGWVVTDGITMAPADSAYKRLSASRISDGIEALIRRVCQPYIGKQNHLANQNALRAAIKSEMDKIKGTLIESYEFRLITDRQAAKLGIIDIDYTIVPVYEIRQIKNQITVQDK